MLKGKLGVRHNIYVFSAGNTASVQRRVKPGGLTRFNFSDKIPIPVFG